MDVLGQGERARQCFWYPLAIATLNEDPELASAALLAEVLKRAFFSRRADSAFVYAKVGLERSLLPGLACGLIEASGGVVADPRDRRGAGVRRGGQNCGRAAARRPPFAGRQLYRRGAARAARCACCPKGPSADPFFRASGRDHFVANHLRSCVVRSRRSLTRLSSASSARRPNGYSTSAGSLPNMANGQSGLFEFRHQRRAQAGRRAATKNCSTWLSAICTR